MHNPRSSLKSNQAKKSTIHRKARLLLEHLEDRTCPSTGNWYAVFGGMVPAINRQDQIRDGAQLLRLSGVPSNSVAVVDALDLTSTFILQTSTSMTEQTLNSILHNVPGYQFVQEYPQPIDEDHSDLDVKNQPPGDDFINYEVVDPNFNYEQFLSNVKNGLIPDQSGPVGSTDRNDILTNNNLGNGGTNGFTHSETTIVAFGTHVVVGFNDSGSYQNGATNHFTGYAYSDDSGVTWTDGGTLPNSAGGDAGDPALARDNTTGRIYFATLGFNVSNIQVFHSDDNGHTWSAPVNGTPGAGVSEDKEWITVDNFAGSGQGNVYVITRDFGSGNGIYLHRSTDQGVTFGPGVNLSVGSQGAFVAVGPDHAVYVFGYNGTTITMRKSVDQGLSFGPTVTVASGLVGGVNGDLGLTGTVNGGGTSGFRSSEFPHAAVNPVNGNIYVVYANKGAGVDKADIFLAQSTNGGVSFNAPVKVNDDVTTTDQWQPTLAVSPDGSRVAVFYYSRQVDTANNNLFRYWGRIAAVSGGTLNFLPSFAVSDTDSLPEFGRDAPVVTTYMGDYNFAAAPPGFFDVAWSDNRFPVPGGAPRLEPDVFFKAIPLGLVVASTVPAVGSVVSTAPSSFIVNTSDTVDPASLQATDFSVNGIPANSFSYTPGTTTITFNFSSTPVTVEGLQTMHINAGAFTRASDGSPVLQFDGTFRYDTLVLAVTSTVPPVGGTFTLPGPFNYDVNFNEAFDPASIQTSDLTLSGIPGAFVSGVSFLNANTTARFVLSGMTINEGTLTASIAAGAITDPEGNPCAAFSGSYNVDIGTAQYPTPLTAKNPFGSLIYDPSVNAGIQFVGDTDSFTINLDAGQVITLLVHPTQTTLQPTVTLRDPANNVIGTATAGAPNQNALLQTVAMTTAGTYTITVSGGSTTGTYNLQLTLNAALEAEGLLPGVTNNTLATAQNLDGGFTNLQSLQSFAQRNAVLGTGDGVGGVYTATPVTFAFEDISGTGTIIPGLDGQDDTSVSIPMGLTFPLYGTNYTTIFISSNGLLTFGSGNAGFTNADLTTTPAQAAISPFWDDLHTAGGAPNSHVYFQVTGSGNNQHLTIQWNQIRFFSGGTAGDTITFEAQLYVDGRIQFNYPDLVSGGAGGNNGASATVGIKDVGTQGANRLLLAFNNGPNTFVGTGQSTLISVAPGTTDYYAFTLGAGQRTTIAAVGGVGTLQLRNSSDVVIATGVGGSTNVTSEINNFQVAAAGTYYITVSGGGAYNLLVTRGAAFDTHPNQSMATAQNITGSTGALGALQQGGGTQYSAAAITPTFEDISTSGTVLTGLDGQDDASVNIPIGFTFSFYNVNYTSIFVSSNGLTTFGTGNAEFGNADMTTDPTQAAIAPYWDDQFILGGANTHVFSQVSGTGNNQHLTIQWNNISYFADSTLAGGLTYELQLYVDGRIQLNYQSLATGNNGGANDNAASATVGIKDAGTQGANRLLLDFNGGPNAFVGSGQSTLISLPPAEDWYAFNVTSTNSQIYLATSTPGDGAGEPVNVLNPHIQLFDPNGVQIAVGTVLGDGRNETIKLPSSPLVGTYKVRVTGEGGTSGEYFLGLAVKTIARMGPGSPLPPAAGKSGDVIKGILPPLMTPITTTGSTSSSTVKTTTTGSTPSASGRAQTNAIHAAAPALQHSTLDTKTLAHFLTNASTSNLSASMKIVDALMAKLNA